MADPLPAPQPRTLLQYILVYPSLLLALGGSVPTVLHQVEAWRRNVRVSEVGQSKEQEALWQRNLGCLVQGTSWEVDGPRGLVIKLTVCKETADILIRYFAQNWTPTYRWVRAPEGGQPDHPCPYPC